MPEKRSRRRRRPGRTQAPPPALMNAGEPFEGFHLLGEGAGGQAALLWQSVRDVLLWAGASAEGRRTLFAVDAEQHRLALLLDPGIDGALRAPLVTHTGVLRAESEITREDMAAACGRISRRAEERGLPQTAVSFAQAAAVVVPESAAHAYRVGLLCRHNAEYTRAETWFRRAIVLSRNKDPGAYALVHIGLGTSIRSAAATGPRGRCSSGPCAPRGERA